ncbi:MAG: xanthine dehydrogenase family protein subunit M [Alphaproteobacteria bacterium]
MLPQFDLVEPRSLKDALDVLAEQAGSTVPLAGGTNVLVDMRTGRRTADRLVSLQHLGELRGLGKANGEVVLGARTTLTDLVYDPRIGEAAPALASAARVFAGAMVRNVATIAGNVCSASPAADLVPPLMTLGATVVLKSRGGERTVPLDQFYPVLHEIARRKDELVTAFRWPKRPDRSAHAFYKLALRKGDAITVTSVAVLLGAEGGKCTSARIALGAVAPTVMRVPEAERILVGAALTDAVLAKAASLAQEACRPIDDIRASAEYRRHAVGVLVRRLVAEAWERVR